VPIAFHMELLEEFAHASKQEMVQSQPWVLDLSSALGTAAIAAQLCGYNVMALSSKSDVQSIRAHFMLNTTCAWAHVVKELLPARSISPLLKQLLRTGARRSPTPFASATCMSVLCTKLGMY
jgi:DNA-binding transcriptional regulator YbjK